ncbi:MAG TPA: histidine kinase [Chthoniobacteraceae bacterium]|nr:histidine kinase [Chthoniobacteraceae bacterium]
MSPIRSFFHLDTSSETEGSHWRMLLLGHPAYWICQSIGWFGSASGEIMVSLLHSKRTALEIGFSLLGACLGIGVSHLLRVVICWRNAFTWTWPRQFAFYLLACIPAAGLYAVLFLPLVWHFNPYDTAPEQSPGVILDTLYWTYSALLVWCGFYFGWHYFLNYQKVALDRVRLDAALHEAELRALRGQLNPHFLFNALNSIRSLIESNPTRARDAITLLAQLLRSSLYSNEHKLIPLERELEAVESYLKLELIRLEDRLKVAFDLPVSLRKIAVPPLCLQMLVENAVKHGISPSTCGGTIRVTGRLEGKRLLLAVDNTPGHLRLQGGGRSGVGLHNLRSRINLLFGDDAELSLCEQQSAEGPQVRAELRLPTESTAARR